MKNRLRHNPVQQRRKPENNRLLQEERGLSVLFQVAIPPGTAIAMSGLHEWIKWERHLSLYGSQRQD